MNKGQVTLGIAIISGIGMLLASVVTAWGTSSARVNTVDKNVAIVTERENNHYEEVQKQLIRQDSKMDEILKRLDSIGTAVRVPIVKGLATSSVTNFND